MVIADFKSTDLPIYISGSAPTSPATGQVWWNSSQSGTVNVAGILFVYNGTAWVSVCQGARLTNRNDEGTYGTPVEANTTNDNSVNPSSSGDFVIGVMGEDLDTGVTGLIITRGYVDIPTGTFTGTINIYDYLLPSATAFKIQASGSSTATAFGRVIASTASGYLCLITGPLRVT
jgi:hypothetical protein